MAKPFDNAASSPVKSALHVLMVASENDGIKTPAGREAKSGGIGDVVRDIAPAVASLHNCRITAVVPSHGLLDKLQGTRLLDVYHFPFAGSREGVTLFEVPGKKPTPKVRHRRAPCTVTIARFVDGPTRDLSALHLLTQPHER